jgi:soluble lytic murein transglycosylase-like protein
MVATTLRIYFALLVLAFASTTCRADCFDAAAKQHHVSPTVLRAIAEVESGNNPHAVNRNRNGTVDLGMMQINSIHLRELRKHGVKRRDLMNECKNIYTGAWLLRRKIDEHGNNWKAVGAYHSETPKFRRQYAKLVERHAERLEAVRMMASND